MLGDERQRLITPGIDFSIVSQRVDLKCRTKAKTKLAANLDFTDHEAGPELRNTTWKWEDTGYWFSG